MSSSETNPRRSKAKAANSAAKPASFRESTATIGDDSTTLTGRVLLGASGLQKALSKGFVLGQKGYKFLFESITKVGLLALLFMVLWVPLGLQLGWPEFQFLGAVSALILLVAIPFLLGGNNYRIVFALPEEDHIDAGVETEAPIYVTNTGNHLQFPGVLEVNIGSSMEELAIPLLRADETKTIDFSVPPQRRGLLQIGPITTVKTDPVETLRRENQLVEKKEIYVYPQIRQLPRTREGILRDLEGNPTVNIVESDLSFHSVREYVAGDNPKHIHWKLTAKIGKPGQFMLRQYEESRRSKMVVILDRDVNAYSKDPEEFEVAVSAVGSMGISAIRDQREIGVLAGVDVPKLARGLSFRPTSFRVQTKNSLLRDLCLVESSDLAMNIKDVSRFVKGEHPDVSLIIIMTGSKLEPKAMQEIKLALPSGVGILFVVSDTSADAEPRFAEISGMKVFTITEIQDLPGLMGRFVR
jgi:uncharacterized protein (DUF58 family)